MHSTDIAFKPTVGGWGYNAQFARGWDAIFENGESETSASAAPSSSALPSIDSEKLAALEAARDIGALSDELFAQARRELEHGAVEPPS